jgi:hypothetical protein
MGRQAMTKRSWFWSVLLALAGCAAAGYLVEEAPGGALGWTLAGAVLGLTCLPLIRLAFQIRAQRDAKRAARKGGSDVQT